MNTSQIKLCSILENLGIIYNNKNESFEFTKPELIIYKNKKGHNKRNLDDINIINSCNTVERWNQI